MRKTGLYGLSSLSLQSYVAALPGDGKSRGKTKRKFSKKIVSRPSPFFVLREEIENKRAAPLSAAAAVDSHHFKTLDEMSRLSRVTPLCFEHPFS